MFGFGPLSLCHFGQRNAASIAAGATLAATYDPTYQAAITAIVTNPGTLNATYNPTYTPAFTGEVEGLARVASFAATYDPSFTVSITSGVQPTLTGFTFTDATDGEPNQVSVTGTGSTVGYSLQLETLNASDTVIETATVALGSSIPVTGFTTASSAPSASPAGTATQMRATLVGGAEGPSNSITIPVDGLDFGINAITWAATRTQLIATSTGDNLFADSDSFTDLVLSGTGGTVNITGVSGNGTQELRYSLSGDVPEVGDTLTLAYTRTGHDLRDQDANFAADFSGVSVTNNATASSAIDDDFSGFADNAALTSGGYSDFHDTVTGATMQKVAGPQAQINAAATGEDSVINNSDVGSVDHFAEVDHVFANANSSNRLFVFCGSDGDVANGYYFAQFNADGSAIIQRGLNGGETTLASGSFTPVATGSSATYRIERNATSGTIDVLINEVSVVSVTGETTYTTGQKIGFGHRLAGGNAVGDSRTTALRGDTL